MNPVIIGGGVEAAAGPSPDCGPETFTVSGGDEDDVDGYSIFDTELDGESDLFIYDTDDVLRALIDNTTNMMVRDNDCFDDATDVTIKFKVRWDDITAIDDGGGNNHALLIETSGYSTEVSGVFSTSGGDLASYRVYAPDAGGLGSQVTMTGVAANTWYYCWLYAKNNASTGGASFRCCADDACSTGWSESNLDWDDDTSGWDLDWVKFGPGDVAWGDGTDDCNMDYDDYEVYLSDQRP
jgi:hypothetical protein